MDNARPYTALINLNGSFCLPFGPVKTVHRPQRDLHAPIGSLPQVVRDLSSDVGPPCSDRVEASSEAESDDSVLSRASEVLADEYHWKAKLEELFKRSVAVREQLHQLSGSSEKYFALRSIADKLDGLALNYDCSPVRPCTSGVFDQSVECSPRTSGHPRGWAPGVDLGGGGRRAKQVPREQVLEPSTPELTETSSAERSGQPPSKPAKKLRCLFYVGDNETRGQCESTFNCMRDLM
jgi:hypothetical protein